MNWWLNNNLRMIQNNIRDIDVKIHPKRYVEWLKYFHANTLQIGCGGITANYPSELPFQYVNPELSGDFIREIIEECHAAGIRVIVRFDFSKTRGCYIEKYPEWFVRTAEQDVIRYHDMAATCVNGAYQQEMALKIIREVLEKYPVDGIFFNMFGYITFDYSGNHFGHCQCENCRRRFEEMYGRALPGSMEETDSDYEEFKRVTTKQLLERIKALVMEIRPEAAVSTYAENGVDIVRSESNSAVDRPLPFWIYQSEDNVATVEGSYSDKIASNCCINAVDLPYRFMGVSKYLNAFRLYGNLMAGGGLDWCIIGNFDDYTDYENFEVVKNIFTFHEKYENYYGHFDSRTRIMLVKEEEPQSWNAEYRGIFKILKEQHLQFTVVRSEVLGTKAEEFDGYDYILLPNVHRLDSAAVEGLKRTRARVIASGCSLREDSRALEELFGIRLAGEDRDVRGTYFKPLPRDIFDDFPERKWIFLDGTYQNIQLLEGTQGVLPKVEKALFGPPEYCYGHKMEGAVLGAVYKEKNIYMAFQTGKLYYRQGYEEFSRVYLDLMGMGGEICREFETDASPMVELCYASCGENIYMLQAANLGGFNGVTFFEPPATEEIHVKFREGEVAYVQELTPEGTCETAHQGNSISFGFARGELYKAYLIHTEPCSGAAKEFVETGK